MTLLLSIVALLLGPFVYALGLHRPTLKQVLDGFIFITIAGIVCVYIVPPAVAVGGPWAIAALLLGLAFPFMIEKSAALSLHAAHGFVLMLAALGLVIHAMLDGIALLPEFSESPAATAPRFATAHDSPLSIGVILHRIPLGMAIWWSVRPTFGVAVAVTTFALIIIATAVSYLFGASVVEITETRYLALFQAFVAGSIAHVVAFGVSHEHEEAAAGRRDWGFRAGVLLGMFIVFTLPHLA